MCVVCIEREGKLWADVTCIRIIHSYTQIVLTIVRQRAWISANITIVRQRAWISANITIVRQRAWISANMTLLCVN